MTQPATKTIWLMDIRYEVPLTREPSLDRIYDYTKQSLFDLDAEQEAKEGWVGYDR